MQQDNEPLAKKLQALERENKILREGLAQSDRIRLQWQESLLHLRAAKGEIERLRLGERKVVETIREGVLVTKSDGTIISVNPSFTRITGFESAEVIGRNPRILKSERHDHKFYEEMWKSITGNGFWQGEIWNKRKDGAEYAEMLSIATVFGGDGKPLNYIGVFSDITSYKLEHQQLLDTTEHAERALKLKDQFVSLVSHDLKSPLTSIMGLLRVLSADVVNPLSAEQKGLVQHVIETGARMVDMIESLLNISRLQTGKIVPQLSFYDAHHLASVAVASNSVAARSKKVELVNAMPEGTRMYCDFQLFMEVLQNLVGNGIKFCKAGDKIEIRPGTAPGSIEVADTGVGMEDSYAANIFKHEVKTSKLGTAGEVGSGLGLPYCKDIISAHSGTIKVSSKPGRGTVFEIALPIVKPRVLVIDDDTLARHMMIARILKAEAEIFEAENGEVGLAAVIETKPHLVICDVMMPVMDGLEFLRQMKINPSTRHIPVLIITGDSIGNTRDKAVRGGADDFTMKSSELSDLLPRVRKFIG